MLILSLMACHETVVSSPGRSAIVLVIDGVRADEFTSTPPVASPMKPGRSLPRTCGVGWPQMPRLCVWG